jgi:hypothetical protein
MGRGATEGMGSPLGTLVTEIALNRDASTLAGSWHRKGTEVQDNDTPRKSSVNPLPYPPAPYAIRDDPRCTRADYDLAGALLRCLQKRASGEVTNKTLAKKMRSNPRTVRECLARLQAAGWIKCESHRGKNRRTITLTWRAPMAKTDDSETAPMADFRHTPMADSRHRCIDSLNVKESLSQAVPLLGVPSPPGVSPPVESSMSKTLPFFSSENGTAASDDPIEELRAIIDSLWCVGEGTPEAQGAIRRGRVLLMDVLSDTVRSRGFHGKILKKGIANGELTPDQFWEAHDSARDKAACDYDPLENFAKYFTGALMKIWRKETKADEDQAFEEEVDERRANGEF